MLGTEKKLHGTGYFLKLSETIFDAVRRNFITSATLAKKSFKFSKDMIVKLELVWLWCLLKLIICQQPLDVFPELIIKLSCVDLLLILRWLL